MSRTMWTIWLAKINKNETLKPKTSSSKNSRATNNNFCWKIPLDGKTNCAFLSPRRSISLIYLICHNKTLNLLMWNKFEFSVHPCCWKKIELNWIRIQEKGVSLFLFLVGFNRKKILEGRNNWFFFIFLKKLSYSCFHYQLIYFIFFWEVGSDCLFLVDWVYILCSYIRGLILCLKFES